VIGGAALLEKLWKIEALHAGAATEAERADAARRIAQTRTAEPGSSQYHVPLTK
jgi:hypothetical protein